MTVASRQTGVPPSSTAARLVAAAQPLQAALAQGQVLDARLLRHAMTTAFGGSDAEGLWDWKLAYEAMEVAQIQFLHRFLPAMRASAPSAEDLLELIRRVAALTPTHTRRSEDSVRLQQFSTPLPYATIVAEAAALSAHDIVLEPSAGTGLLAVHAASRGARLHLNEWAGTRADLLQVLFPAAVVTRHNGEHIDDVLADDFAPSVVLMNPPFTASPHIAGRCAGAEARHVRSALKRLAPGGRLVTITSAAFSPREAPALFDDLASLATLRVSAPVWGQLYGPHGTTITTRLSVFDKVPGPVTLAVHTAGEAMTWSTLLGDVLRTLPPRLPCSPRCPETAQPRRAPPPVPHPRTTEPRPAPDACVPLTYHPRDVPAAAPAGDSLYEPYAPERIVIPGAADHPTTLVQSTAMASVVPPMPRYRPQLPEAIVRDALLSAPQLESVIYAGDAHSQHLAGSWLVNATLDQLTAAPDEAEGAVRFRRGWFLGDGTGAGKGRQVAGILLDNWMQGRRRAVWISKSDKLLEDAQRDWSALGQEKLLIVPQDRYRQGKPIRLAEGILFTTYATLRSAEREGKSSRLDQLLHWLGRDFDGVIVFDEAHAMANAAGTTGQRGAVKPSQQGLAGLRLQHALPDARVVYVSATGATTVENLGYAQRLGLWGSDDLPFPTRGDFVAAMQQGGIASAEVLARDLKALGLYMARSLSYDGVTVDMLEHTLTADQIAIYDAYAAAYQIIHHNLTAALTATGVTHDEQGTLNPAAKSAARSAFESSKQRFFGHLITAMKVPTLLAAMRHDLAEGRAVLVQLVSTAEALLDRRLADIPVSEWGDLSFDITPREYVLDYLKHSFPTQLFEPYSDDEGNVRARPVMVDGQPVQSREAVARRDRMIEHLAALPPVQSALDQIIHAFGSDAVAEVTGRSRRVIVKGEGPCRRLAVENRPASANLSETQAFMDDAKRILVFSDAGGTGRSYHADRRARNQRPRVHYLLEAGWKADTAIQGLGRSNRTNQKQPPVFSPVASDVRGEKRFLSTIARRLDSLGAITRGQRQTGGQGLFRATDNLEIVYGRAALRHLYSLLHQGKVACCSLQRFEDATGLSLLDADGSLREDLPPISTFLNRTLALPIALQNDLFDVFEGLLIGRIEQAQAAGTYDAGLETIQAESLRVVARRVIATHPVIAAETQLVEVVRKDRLHAVSLDDALARASDGAGAFLHNTRSGRVALRLAAPALTLEDGTVEPRVRLVRPTESSSVPADVLEDSHWTPCSPEVFAAHWRAEIDALPTHQERTLHLLTGLLLPLWKSLPGDNPRVYRLTTDDGERIIGRVLEPHEAERLAPTGQSLSSAEVWQRLNSGVAISFDDGSVLKPCTVMYARRFELIGFEAAAVERLKALGLTSEIIAWKLRLFLSTGSNGPAILDRLMATRTARSEASHAA